ncbi:hypothetical protein EON66_07215 [archaeon]|nr:MAG: hypothetical protein EON66_07215 [archaeon]
MLVCSCTAALVGRASDLSTAELELERYKIMLHVTVGENRGEGVRIGAKCLWDDATDKMAVATYQNVRAAHTHARVRACAERGAAAVGQRFPCASPVRVMQDSLFAVATAYAVYLY